MGILDGKRKHIQVVVGGNLRDVIRHEKAERKRKWFIFLDIVAVICLLIGVGLIYYNKNYTTGGLFVVIGLVILLYFVFRRSFRRTRNFTPQNRNFHKNRHRRFKRRRF